MKAAILHGPRELRVEAARAPEPGADQALVRVAVAGLCGTDYSIFSGDRPVTYPRVMGHEFVGRVEAVGPGVTTPRVGDRVAIEPNYSCGLCPLCREGNRNLCLSRTAVGIDVDGCFAQAVTVPSRCCWPVPHGATDERFLLTEPLAVVVRAADRGAPRAGEAAAVVGVGTLGLLALQVLRARGARVLALGRTTKRFELAESLGAESTQVIADADLGAVARQFSGREGVDLVIETAGTAEAVLHALDVVRPGGRVVLTGLPHEPTSVRFFNVVRREVTILGSMIYQDEFPAAMRLLEEGHGRTQPLVTH